MRAAAGCVGGVGGVGCCRWSWWWFGGCCVDGCGVCCGNIFVGVTVGCCCVVVVVVGGGLGR